MGLKIIGEISSFSVPKELIGRGVLEPSGGFSESYSDFIHSGIVIFLSLPSSGGGKQFIKKGCKEAFRGLQPRYYSHNGKRGRKKRKGNQCKSRGQINPKNCLFFLQFLAILLCIINCLTTTRHGEMGSDFI